MIDKSYFEPNLKIYYCDYFLSLGFFGLAFAWGLHANWPLVAIPWFLASVFLARAGIFGHELAHRPNDRRMKRFYWVWHLTVSAIIMVPIVRFIEPHRTHHTTGIFRTPEDPQYLLVRSNKALAVFVLVVLPFVTPVYTLLQAIVASIGGVALEERIDRFTRRTFNFSVSMPFSRAKHAEVTWLARYSLLLLGGFFGVFPEALPFFYAVLVGAWTVIVLRIPLEHELESYAESSDKSDQMRDSFTIDTSLAEVIQPIGFRYHTAHHMYPAVPYHNLPALHAHLKASVPGYNRSVLSYWDAIRGPKAAVLEDGA